MVGVPTSNRCDNCRKRKKKCDERRPSCSECTRGGWPCPGYTAHWKFVDETARLAGHYAGRKYVYDVIDSDIEGSYSRCVNKDEESDRTVAIGVGGFQVFHKSHWHGQSAIPAASNIPRFYNPNPLGSQLAFCLESKVSGSLIPLRFIGSFFEFVPARLGHNVALDDSVSCLCAIYGRTYSTLNKVDTDVYRKYARALSSLRSCLSDEALRMEPETLCATVLLQACELVVNVDTGEWSNLARGTAFLMHSRSVHRYQTAFEHAMLESQLSYILGQSMKFKEHCFLEKSEWQDLISKSSIWPYQNRQAQTLDLKSRLCATLSHVPGLIVDCSELNTMLQAQPGWRERSENLLQRVIEVSEDIKQWLTVEAEPLFLARHSSDQVRQNQIQYPDLICAVIDCVANSTLIAVNRVLEYHCNMTLLSNRLGVQVGKQHIESYYFIDDIQTTERRRQRAIAAFNIVREESEFAAKPLEFGLRQIKACGSYDASRT